MRIKTIFWRAFLSVLILTAGFLGMQTMAALKKAPPKQTPPHPGTLVETVSLALEAQAVTVWATGTVQPRMAAEIVPQVSGRVIAVSPEFIPGGIFNKGELFFEIEPVDYELATQKSRAAVVKAEYELAQVESQARVARVEWDRIRLTKKNRPNPLVLYEPQLKNARAALSSMRAELKVRQLDIKRTKIFAPFNCRIKSESVDPGQYVTAGKSAGMISGTDIAEVIVPIPMQDLQWLDVPRRHQEKTAGSPATVSVAVDDRRFDWQGSIDRSLGEVDPKGRMIRLAIRVEDPYGLTHPDAENAGYYLAEGLFVDVRIKGKTVSDVFAIPAGALREKSTVWTMGADDRLHIHDVRVIRREKERVFIRGKMANGDRLILTYLSGAAQGMKLRSPEKG